MLTQCLLVSAGFKPPINKWLNTCGMLVLLCRNLCLWRVFFRIFRDASSFYSHRGFLRILGFFSPSTFNGFFGNYVGALYRYVATAWVFPGQDADPTPYNPFT